MDKYMNYRIYCVDCDEDLEEVKMGIYVCPKCKREAWIDG